MKTNKTTLTPLTPAVFYILLALASGEKHGYEIMKQVKHDSLGHVKMGSGTLRYHEVVSIASQRRLFPGPSVNPIV